MSFDDTVSTIGFAVVGFLFGLVADMLLELVEIGAWFMAVLLVIWIGVVFLAISVLEWVSEVLFRPLFGGSGVRPSHLKKQPKPLYRRLALPVGIAVGFAVAQIVPAQTIIGWI